MDKNNNNNDHDGSNIIIKYEEGMTLDQIMASRTLPDFYDPQKIDGRTFWDGVLLSNTPFRELMHAHM